jgi:hypothetical protein
MQQPATCELVPSIRISVQKTCADNHSCHSAQQAAAISFAERSAYELRHPPYPTLGNARRSKRPHGNRCADGDRCDVPDAAEMISLQSPCESRSLTPPAGETEKSAAQWVLKLSVFLHHIKLNQLLNEKIVSALRASDRRAHPSTRSTKIW